LVGVLPCKQENLVLIPRPVFKKKKKPDLVVCAQSSNSRGRSRNKPAHISTKQGQQCLRNDTVDVLWSPHARGHTCTLIGPQAEVQTPDATRFPRGNLGTTRSIKSHDWPSICTAIEYPLCAGRRAEAAPPPPAWQLGKSEQRGQPHKTVEPGVLFRTLNCSHCLTDSVWACWQVRWSRRLWQTHKDAICQPWREV
jgi:hypothetical protein